MKKAKRKSYRKTAAKVATSQRRPGMPGDTSNKEIYTVEKFIYQPGKVKGRIK